MKLFEQRRIVAPSIINYMPFVFWVLLTNCLIWIPALLIDFPTIGGHDSQIFTAAVHAELRSENGFFGMSPKLLAAREDIYSYPYFGIMYPFYFTFGLNEAFSYKTNLILDFISVVFHMVMASLTFSVLLKRMSCSSSVSIIFGLFYAYSVHMKMWSSWIWALSGYAWIPLCLLGIWETVNNRRYRLGVICMSLGFGLIALGTALPLVYALILSAGFFFFCLLKARLNKADLFKALFCIFLASILSFAIGASHILPTLHQASEYVRWYSGGAITGSFKPPYDGTLSTVLEFSVDGLKQFVMPTKWYGVGHPFIGLSLLTLATYYFVINRRSLYVYPMLLLAVYFLFDAFGDSTFVHRITYAIPVLSSVRYPLANIYITHTVLLLFAALGVSALFEVKSKSRHWLVIFFGVSSVAGAIILWGFQSQLISGFREINSFWFLPSIVFGVMVVAAIKSRYWKVFIVLSLASMLPLNSMLIHPKIPKTNSLYIGCAEFSRIESDLREIRSKILGTPRFATYSGIDFKSDTSACLAKKKLSPQLMNSVAMIAGWDVMQIYLSPRAIKEFRLFNRLSEQYRKFDHAALLRAGVTHVLMPKNYEPSVIHRHAVSLYGKVGDYPLFEVKNFELGQASIGCVGRVEGSKDVSFQSSYGARKITGLPQEIITDDSYHCDLSIPSQSRIVDVDRAGSELSYRLSASHTESVFISDQVFSEEWTASIDEEVVKPFLVDGYRLGVVVPAGAKNIKLAYRPRVFIVGAILTAIGFLAVFMLLLTFVFKESYLTLKTYSSAVCRLWLK